MASVRAQVGVGDGRLALVAGESVQQLGVGTELRWSTVELAGMAQHHSGSSMHGLHDAAQVDVGIAVLAQFADLLAIFAKADDCESALCVGSVGGTQVKEAGAVREFNDVVDVGLDADVLVESICGVVDGEAGSGGCSQCSKRTQQENQR